ncbi:hypothetical protein KJ910_05090 [Patescibacteria group bacterium]|nr:hypothetical protein [Patescibacteria group bacterium]MBU1906570.1 hypothetical protein [Patescibacteria group bacterium]
MAGVTGPGEHYYRDNEQTCDDCEALATHTVLVDRDSFGAEWADLCDAHYAEHQEWRADQRVGECEWCGQTSRDLLSVSDPFDRYCPPSDVCHACYNKHERLVCIEIDAGLEYWEQRATPTRIPEDDIVSPEWIYAYELERNIRREHADPEHACFDAGCPRCHAADDEDDLSELELALIARDERRAHQRYVRRMIRRLAA